MHRRLMRWNAAVQAFSAQPQWEVRRPGSIDFDRRRHNPPESIKSLFVTHTIFSVIPVNHIRLPSTKSTRVYITQYCHY